jgi:hypothetical protein
MVSFQEKSPEISDCSIEDLAHLDRIGIFQGVNEPSTLFIKRASFYLRPLGVKNLRALEAMVGAPVSGVSLGVVKQSLNHLWELYRLRPYWVKMFRRRAPFQPWVGGSMWLLQKEGVTSSPPFPLIWLPLSLRGTRLKEEEIIAHESVHAVRAHLPNSVWEEYLAYQTSSTKLYRWLGPLFSTVWVAPLFMLFLLGFTGMALFGLISSKLCFSILIFGSVGIFLFRAYLEFRASGQLLPLLVRGRKEP